MRFDCKSILLIAYVEMAKKIIKKKFITLNENLINKVNLLSSSITMAPVTSFTSVFAVMVTSGMTTSMATTTSDLQVPKLKVRLY